MKKNLLLIFTIFFITQLNAQKTLTNCDSIFSADGELKDSWNIIHPAPKFDMDSINVSFNNLVKDSLSILKTSKIYVGLFIDKKGNVICSQMLTPVSTFIDSIAEDLAKELKFVPARINRQSEFVEMKATLSIKIFKRAAN